MTSDGTLEHLATTATIPSDKDMDKSRRQRIYTEYITLSSSDTITLADQPQVPQSAEPQRPVPRHPTDVSTVNSRAKQIFESTQAPHSQMNSRYPPRKSPCTLGPCEHETRPLAVAMSPGPVSRPLHEPVRSDFHSSMFTNRTKKENARGPQPADQRHPRHPYHSRSLYIDPGKKEHDEGAPPLERPTYSGSTAGPGWEHMQREVDLLRKAVQDMHKTSKKQTKRIEELKAQLSANNQLLQERDHEIVTLKQRCSKAENLVASIETSIQCQICMDLPQRPFALSPCGHVLCLTCLQEWFKTTPGAIGDDDDEDSSSIVLREKTCPCCRTVVRHRPSPVFMIKAVTAAFLNDKETIQSTDRPNPAEETLDEDPWKDIFPISDDEDCEEGDESDDDLDDEDPESDWMVELTRTHPSRFSWSSGSEDERYSVPGQQEEYDDDTSSEEEFNDRPARYVVPHWEPPTVRIEPLDHDLEDLEGENRENVLCLLRRGCSWGMIHNFNIRYSRRHGIIVALPSIDRLYTSDDEDSSGDSGTGTETLHHIHLGWNISLDDDDTDGETYIQGVLFDIKNRPERWRLRLRYDGQDSLEIWKLVRSDGPENYSQTDWEAWLDSDTNDVDID